MKITLHNKAVFVIYGESMESGADEPIFLDTSAGENEKRVIVHALKGSTVAITVEEKHYHYHYPEWLTPELLLDMAVALKKRGKR